VIPELILVDLVVDVADENAPAMPILAALVNLRQGRARQDSAREGRAAKAGQTISKVWLSVRVAKMDFF